MTDIERDGSLPVLPVHVTHRHLRLKYVKRRHVQQEPSETNSHAFIMPGLRPLNSRYLNLVHYNVWGIIQQRVYQTIVQDVNNNNNNTYLASPQRLTPFFSDTETAG